MANSMRVMELESGEAPRSGPESPGDRGHPEDAGDRHLYGAVPDDSRESGMGVADNSSEALLSCEVKEECEIWGERIEISDLPALQRRTWHYYTRPFRGVFVVAFIICMMVGAVQGVGPWPGFASDVAPPVRRVLVGIMWLWTGLASLSVSCILFARPGVIYRSEAACYPIPQEVGRRLAANESFEGLENIICPTRGSYCVRCFLWRKNAGGYLGSHHCSDCQRCYEGHDHHCFVLGRCIVKKNLHYFFILIGMPPAGFLTTLVAYFWASQQRADS